VLEDRKARRWPWYAALALLAFCVLVGFRSSWLGVSGPTDVMSPGTVLTVRLERTLTSGEALPGEPFEARVVSIQATKGSAVPSPGSEVEGRCVAVRREEGSDRPGYLRLALTGLRDSEGGLMQLESSTFSQWGSDDQRRDSGSAPELPRVSRATTPGRAPARAKARPRLALRPGEAVVTPESALDFVVLDPVPVERAGNP
jgi:hypothetical protein